MKEDKEFELWDAPIPFYIQAAFHRLCKENWECDWCPFNSETDELYGEEAWNQGAVCPQNLWYYTMQRNKVDEAFKRNFKIKKLEKRNHEPC